MAAKPSSDNFQTDFYHYNLAESPAYAGWVENPDYQCGGYYQAPEWAPLSGDTNWEISADKIELKQQGISHLTGGVMLRYGQRYFYADDIEIHTKSDQVLRVQAKGHLRYIDPSMRIEGLSGTWDTQTDTLTISEPEYTYFERHARGSAQSISLAQKTVASFDDAMYTTCAPGKTTWALQGNHITLDRNTGRGSAKNIRLKVKDTTVFYWPYLQFPIDNQRHSGFLFPQVGSTSQSGIEMSLPYYWNIAPNYDLTITPRVLTNRGLDLQNEFRYMSHHSYGQLKFHLLPNDKKYRDFRADNLKSPPIEAPSFDPRLTALQSGNHRVGLNFEHYTSLSPHWWFEADYTYVGDDNYFYDLENDLGSASTTKLNQMASLHFDNSTWQHQLKVQSFDLLHPLLGPVNAQDYRELPSWVFSGTSRYGQFDLLLEGEITRFKHPSDPLTGLEITDGTRYYLRPTVTAPILKWWGFFKPSLALDLLSDDLNLGTIDRSSNKGTHVSRALPIADIDTGLYFDKYYGNGYVQTLEPRMYYLYVPTRNQDDFPTFDTSLTDFSYYQMFRKNRFIGHDRLGDANQTTIALTTRVLDPQGEEMLRFSVGEIFYFKERAVTLCQPQDTECFIKEDPDRDRHFSPIITNLVMKHDAWLTTLGAEWNPNHSQIDKGYASVEYAPSRRQAISLSYYWMRRNPYEEQVFLVETPLNQASLGLFWPVTKQIDLIGHYRYDFEHQRLIEILGGLEYDTCCLSVQLVGNRTLRPNDGLSPVEYANGVFFQVLFKGLSSVGSKKADSKLKKTIPRYTSFAKRNDFSRKI